MNRHKPKYYKKPQEESEEDDFDLECCEKHMWDTFEESMKQLQIYLNIKRKI